MSCAIISSTIKAGTDYYVLRDHEIRHADGTINPFAVADFCHAYKEDCLRPYVRTQPVPAELYENGVRVAVGATFEDVVLNEAVDQLVLVYNPDNQRTAEAMQAIEEFAQKYKHPEAFEVVKINGVLNYLPGSYDRSQSPALFFAKKSHKRRPEIYSGSSFSHAELLAFVQSPKEDL